MSQALSRQDRAHLERTYGIHLPASIRSYMPREWRDNDDSAFDELRLAADAQPTLFTQANGGVPALFTTYVDPEIIEVMVTPVKAAEIYGETKKGDWTVRTAAFPMVESAGRVSVYGDFSNDGMVSANAQWVYRQSFEYQTWTQWGDRELAEYGAAKIDYASRLDISSAVILNKAQNLFYLFGVTNLQNYGVLNDPSLPASITPGIKIGGGTTWASTTDPIDIYNDFVRLFAKLNTQMGGILTLNDKLKVVLPTGLQTSLLNVNLYGVNIRKLLQADMPNLTIDTLPELGIGVGQTSSVNTIQMFVETVQGRKTVTTAFTEKMRAHTVERYSTYTRQKKSQGTWGAMWFYPLAVATMVGC